MKIHHNIYPKLSTWNNIIDCYKEFRKGKKNKSDVITFHQNAQKNLKQIHQSLNDRSYKPGPYEGFYITDPKLRLIHKATVSDRIVHHIVSRELDPIFEPIFISHSYSCRKDKGTLKGVLAFHKMALQASKNNTKVCWSLKCDVKKFFASVNHKILYEILSRRIGDIDFLALLERIIDSFYSDRTIDINDKKGIPIGNLTSQFFANIYLDDLDKYIKHTLKVKYYVRYADDFVMLSDNRKYLESLVLPIKQFLKERLDLNLHPDKIIFNKFSSGVDFLGYIIFPRYILPRTKTKKRLIKKIKRRIKEYKIGLISEEKFNQTIQSYLGYLSHANAYKFREELLNLVWFLLTE